MLVLEVLWIACVMDRPRVGDVPPARAIMGIVVGVRGGGWLWCVVWMWFVGGSFVGG